MTDILLAHAGDYPKSEIADFIKLIYQSEFGPGHLVCDPASARFRLYAEAAAAGRADTLFEPIGGGYARLHLGALKAAGLSEETAANMFAWSAGRGRGSLDGLAGKLHEFTALCGRELPFDRGEAEAAVADYLNRGAPAESHSAAYRAAYLPAYRVVEDIFARYADFFIALGGRVRFAAIDGQAGAGKTTLAEAAAGAFDLNVFHADDFFLPPDMRTPARLMQPGGNVHFERLKSEVIDGVASGKPFCYRPYDCRTDCLLDEVSVAPKPKNLIEGAYCLHPALREGYDLKVFLGVEPEEQRRRIRARVGEEFWRQFEKRWIPLENTYIEKLGIRQLCDLSYIAGVPGGRKESEHEI